MPLCTHCRPPCSKAPKEKLRFYVCKLTQWQRRCPAAQWPQARAAVRFRRLYIRASSGACRFKTLQRCAIMRSRKGAQATWLFEARACGSARAWAGAPSCAASCTPRTCTHVATTAAQAARTHHHVHEHAAWGFLPAQRAAGGAHNQVGTFRATIGAIALSLLMPRAPTAPHQPTPAFPLSVPRTGPGLQVAANGPSGSRFVPHWRTGHALALCELLAPCFRTPTHARAALCPAHPAARMHSTVTVPDLTLGPPAAHVEPPLAAVQVKFTTTSTRAAPQEVRCKKRGLHVNLVPH